MSYTAERCFLDTNMLIYAHDSSSGEKHEIARDLVKNLWETRNGVLSTQVMQEFYVTVTRKIPHPLSHSAALRILNSLGEWKLHQVSMETISSGAELANLHKLSFWDGLIIASALDVRARYLITEDMQHGFKVGELELVNPFGG
jgi:predicted nucleic acid-binding protein